MQRFMTFYVPVDSIFIYCLLICVNVYVEFNLHKRIVTFSFKASKAVIEFNTSGH